MQKLIIFSLMTISSLSFSCFKSKKQIEKMSARQLVAKTIVCTKLVLPLPAFKGSAAEFNGSSIKGISQVAYNHQNPSEKFNAEKLGYTFPKSFGAEGVHYKNCVLFNADKGYDVVSNYFDSTTYSTNYKNSKKAARQFKKAIKQGKCEF